MKRSWAHGLTTVAMFAAHMLSTGVAEEAERVRPLSDMVEFVFRVWPHTHTLGLKPGTAQEVALVLRRRLEASEGHFIDRSGKRVTVRDRGHVSVRARLRAGVKPDQFKEILMRRGRLELRLCTTAPERLRAASQGRRVEGYTKRWVGLLEGKEPRADEVPPLWFLVEDRVRITGEDIEDAYPTSQGQDYGVGFKMNGGGSKLLSELTANNIGAPLAIILDGKLLSAPTIGGRIAGKGVISGAFRKAEAYALASVLDAGELPAALEPVAEPGQRKAK